VTVNVPRPDEIPSGCVLKLDPVRFRLSPNESVTLNMTVNTSKSVTENVTSLIELVVHEEQGNFLSALKRSAAARCCCCGFMGFVYLHCVILLISCLRSKLRRTTGAGGSSMCSKYFLVVAFPYTPMLNGRSGDTDSYLLARFCAEGDVAAIKSLLDRRDLDAGELLKVRI
jgi:hypothetical protein